MSKKIGAAITPVGIGEANITNNADALTKKITPYSFNILDLSKELLKEEQCLYTQ